MASSASSSAWLLLLSVTLLLLLNEFADAHRRRIHVTDDLSEVVDDEEDEDFKAWGATKPKPEPEPMDITNMMQMGDDGKPDISAMLAAQQQGPAMGFVKLKPGTTKRQSDLEQLAAKWDTLIRSGMIQPKFYPIEENTILITVESGKELLEVRQFILEQPEVLHLDWNQQRYTLKGNKIVTSAIDSAGVNKKKPKHARKAQKLQHGRKHRHEDDSNNDNREEL
eukprot:jgi/Chlat1/2053/Chrsp17S02526